MQFDGAALKHLRASKKWDQHRLAEAARAHGVGITQSQVSRYENGQEPSGRNALALASALGVQVEDLYAANGDATDDDDEESASMPLSRGEFALFGTLLAKVVAASQPAQVTR